ncbi:unnamed protein product [Meloidogyne enterolobii]|uniref:Uncharacterized protein n=2 Tax=Meloidogyne enterolobii TaxID=390850 RepID=A0ACB0ZKW6_MELEN|nr:unnamed protein product [Meloidogyne enterolobii]
MNCAICSKNAEIVGICVHCWLILVNCDATLRIAVCVSWVYVLVVVLVVRCINVLLLQGCLTGQYLAKWSEAWQMKQFILLALDAPRRH